MTYQERGEALVGSLRRLSTAQLRSRFKKHYKITPDKRLSREALVRAVWACRIEPGLQLSIPLTPSTKETVFDILLRDPGTDPGEVVRRVQAVIPSSRITKREIPWYKLKIRESGLRTA